MPKTVRLEGDLREVLQQALKEQSEAEKDEAFLPSS